MVGLRRNIDERVTTPPHFYSFHVMEVPMVCGLSTFRIQKAEYTLAKKRVVAISTSTFHASLLDNYNVWRLLTHIIWAVSVSRALVFAFGAFAFARSVLLLGREDKRVVPPWSC